MPTVLSTLKSRIYGREWSFPYNCYEVGHGWTPYCSEAAIDVGYAAFKNVLPLYTSLYLFTQLGLQRKYSREAFFETFKSILTSASFIAFNILSGMVISCTLRNNSDRYYYRIQLLTPALIASYLSLLIERPSRRPALAFYLANMASELLYKYMVSEGLLRPVAHGETLLFICGMATWLRFVRVHGFGHDPVSTALKYLIGRHEAPSRGKKGAIKSIEGAGKQQPQARADGASWNFQFLIELDQSINKSLNSCFGAHKLCPHGGTSCLYYVASPMATRFLIGYLGRSLMLVGLNAPRLLKRPGEVFATAFRSRSSVNIGLFLSTFVGSTRLVHCGLRRLTGESKIWHSTLAGGVSGLSMLFAPKSTLSTYVLWKCLEQYFFLAVDRGQMTRATEVICCTYAVSVNIILYMFALEPSFIRPSYMKFLDKLSDHRLHQLNRMVLDVFGPHASTGYEDWFPNLDPKYLSREFYELIFNWMIQPYE